MTTNNEFDSETYQDARITESRLSLRPHSNLKQFLPENNQKVVCDGGILTDTYPICEFCGEPIEQPGQDCPALDDGRCAP